VYSGVTGDIKGLIIVNLGGGGGGGVVVDG
jgi:hypothetical protein